MKMNVRDAAADIERSEEFGAAYDASKGQIAAVYDASERTAGYHVGTGRKPQVSVMIAIDSPTFYADYAAYLRTTAQLFKVGGGKSAEPRSGGTAQDYLSNKNDPRAAALGVVITAANLPLQISSSTPTNDRAAREYTLTTEDNRRVFRGTFADALVYLGRQIEAGPR